MYGKNEESTLCWFTHLPADAKRRPDKSSHRVANFAMTLRIIRTYLRAVLGAFASRQRLTLCTPARYIWDHSPCVDFTISRARQCWFGDSNSTPLILQYRHTRFLQRIIGLSCILAKGSLYVPWSVAFAVKRLLESTMAFHRARAAKYVYQILWWRSKILRKFRYFSTIKEDCISLAVSLVDFILLSRPSTGEDWKRDWCIIAPRITAVWWNRARRDAVRPAGSGNARTLAWTSSVLV